MMNFTRLMKALLTTHEVNSIYNVRPDILAKQGASYSQLSNTAEQTIRQFKIGGMNGQTINNYTICANLVL